MPKHDSGMPNHDFCMPTHDFCMPDHAFCMPKHDFCMPNHVFRMPEHDFCMPKHGFAWKIIVHACQNVILHAETRFCMSTHGRGPRWSQPGPRRAPAGARWPHGGGEDVNAVLGQHTKGQHTKRLCFTSPGGTREPAGLVVPPLIFH